MIRSGVPDYGMYAALENMGKLVDSGELAARLGSIVTFNREGNVVFWDDFEKTPLKWEIEKELGSETVSLSSETALSGGQCVKMTTAADILSNAGIRRFYPLFSEKKQGAEIAIAGFMTEFIIYIYYYVVLSDVLYKFVVSFDYSNDRVQYLDENEAWVTIKDGIGLKQTYYLFHHYKLVIDLETGCYSRVIIDRNEYPMNELLCNQSVAMDSDYMFTKIKIQNSVASAQEVYLDNFILTQNEP